MAVEYKQVLLKAEENDDEPSNKGKQQLLLLLLGASCLLALTCAALFMTPRAAQVAGTVQLNAKTEVGSTVQFTAKADIRSSEESPKYYWPSIRGNIGSYSKSPYPARFRFKKPSWTWSYNCCFGCTWCTMFMGAVIDDKKFIYVTAADAIRKFSSSGRVLWTTPRPDNQVFDRVSALYDGAVYAVVDSGRAFALSMDTGKELWSTQLPAGVGLTASEVSVAHGVVIHSIEQDDPPATLIGLNTTDGSFLWSFVPDEKVWNFGATFPGDGTFVYQSFDGKIYRNFVNSGALLWKNGGVPGTWTDGQCNLGSNGMVYGVSNYGNSDTGGLYDPDDPFYGFNGTGMNGVLKAYRLSDGHMIWQRELRKTPNSVPAIGMLAGQTKLSVVIPSGVNDREGMQLCVHAFDAETGEDQWVFKGPTQQSRFSPSDRNPHALVQRAYNKVRPVNIANAWGIPAIDGRGAVFVGGITGHVFRLMDLNQDGEVAGHGEVAKMTNDADVCGASGPAMAPGMFVFENSHSLYVWKY